MARVSSMLENVPCVLKKGMWILLFLEGMFGLCVRAVSSKCPSEPLFVDLLSGASTPRCRQAARSSCY